MPSLKAPKTVYPTQPASFTECLHWGDRDVLWRMWCSQPCPLLLFLLALWRGAGATARSLGALWNPSADCNKHKHQVNNNTHNKRLKNTQTQEQEHTPAWEQEKKNTHKNNEHVAVYMELNCSIQVDTDTNTKSRTSTHNNSTTATTKCIVMNIPVVCKTSSFFLSVCLLRSLPDAWTFNPFFWDWVDERVTDWTSHGLNEILSYWLNQLLTEPTVELLAEPIVELLTEPTVELLTEPVTELFTEEVIELLTEPVIELLTEPPDCQSQLLPIQPHCLWPFKKKGVGVRGLSKIVTQTT